MDWWGRYVGLRFGEGPGEVTCWSLVRRVYSDRLGLDLPEYGEIPARELVRVARAMAEGQAAACWSAVQEPDALDVVLMRSGRGGVAVVHVGVMVSVSRMLHVEAASAACVVPVTHFSVAGRIAGFRRWVG